MVDYRSLSVKGKMMEIVMKYRKDEIQKCAIAAMACGTVLMGGGVAYMLFNVSQGIYAGMQYIPQ